MTLPKEKDMFRKYTFIILLCLFSPSQQRMITVDNSNDTLCNQNDSHSYTTLHAALEAVGDNDTIHICNGNYHHNTNTTLTFSNVTITGNGPDVTIVECEGGTGFGFINVTNIIISGLTLSGCGQLRNSTTINSSSSSVMLFRVALYFENVINVDIDNVVVNNSIGMGVAMYDVTGNVTVNNSIFRNNSVPLHENKTYPGGGGVSVEFSFCTPGIVNYCNCTNAFYLFKNCKFEHNGASTNLHCYATETFGSSNQQFGRGGGLSIFFRGHSLFNKIEISDCVFDSNKAVWGGGFHSDIVDYSTGNVLTLENCIFTNNDCDYDDNLMTTGTGGGGARIAFLFYDPRSTVTSNSVQFINCKFQSNKAYYGGGLSCRITKESNVLTASNSLELVNCTWVENIARTGSGVDIISHVFPHGVSPVVKIINCNFTANSNSYSKSGAFPLGIGALYADNIPVSFSGNCIFDGNKHSAVAGMGTYFIFSNDTSVMFYNNSGWHGAGMALLGNAYFIVYHNTSLQFINNSAVTKGGAIYYINSGQKDFVSTQRCLMYYYDVSVHNYSKWATTLNFSGNYAYFGKSIHCTTLLSCVWINQPENVNVTINDILQVFNWSGVFYYDGNYNRSEEIATDTASINISISGHVKIPPGQFYHLDISSVDDRGQAAYPVIVAETSNPDVALVNVIDNASDILLVLHGKIKYNISLDVHSFNNRPFYTSINIMLDECPPGFYYPSNDNEPVSEKICKCSTNTPKHFYGITDCNSKKLAAHLNPQVWAGYVDLEGAEKLMTSDCPLDYCVNTRVQLPANSSHEALESLVCSSNRNSTLCGKCQQGYYVYVNSPTYQCGLCNDTISNHGVLVLIVSKYLPLTLMMCFIIFFDISLVDGPLNSFILFCQILVTFPLDDNDTQVQGFSFVLLKFVNFMYNIWNMKFFECFVRPFCALKFDSALPALAAEYITAFYVLVLCVMFFNFVPLIYHCCTQSRLYAIQYCTLKIERMCIRFRYRWSVRNSVIHSLTTFLVLSYARITLVTFKLLAPMVLYGEGGQDSHYRKTVLWFDGTKSYFGSDHLPYALGAIFMLITFVLIPPLLLLSYPLLPALMTRLGLEDYWIVKKLITNPLSKCVPIFDAFQSCYKDEYRFFAGLLFVYRIIASVVFASTPSTALNFACLLGFLQLILLLHCTCQPYRNKWHNIIDGVIFTVFVSITTVAFYQFFQEETTNAPSNSSFWIQTVLLYCPLVYFTVFTSVKVLLWLYPRIVLAKHKLCGNNNPNNVVGVANLLDSHEFPARMEDDGDSYSTTSDCSSGGSTLPDDEQRQEQPQESDDDIELIHPVDWNAINVDLRIPSHKLCLSRNRVFTQ